MKGQSSCIPRERERASVADLQGAILAQDGEAGRTPGRWSPWRVDPRVLARASGLLQSDRKLGFILATRQGYVERPVLPRYLG